MPTYLDELVDQRASAHPTALAFGGQEGLLWRTLDGQQVRELVDQLAGELAAQGIGAGDRVVLWLPNGWRTPLYFFALWRRGAIAVPFDREMNPEAAASIVAAVAPRCIIAGYGERPGWAGTQPLLEWWEPGSGSAARPAGAGEAPERPDLAVIYYTSGTTGQPKGCMLTHANLLSQVDTLRHNIPLDPACRLASLLPLSHIFELTCGLLYPFSRGAAIHYIPSRRRQDILRVLSEQRITHMIVVPQMLTMMGQALDERLRGRLPAPLYRLLVAAAERAPFAARRWLFWPVHRQLGGHLQLMASGGAALPVATQHLWERLGVRIVQGYGTTETSPVVAAGEPDGSTPAGSVGTPVRGVEVRLSAEGEILVRGPNVMRGYWQDPARTADAFVDGWYATGDLARVDAQGNIWLEGRARDLIVLPSGLNVWPQDIEDLLQAQPGVKDAAVIAVPTASGGARLHAYLLPDDPARRAADPAPIIAAANQRLALHQRVASASWWPETDFPRTTTLKVRRHLLPLPAEVAPEAAPPLPGEVDVVGQAIASAARVPMVHDEQTLTALGLDSLGLTELAVSLEEKTGRTVADSDLHLDMTVGQVREVLAGAPALAGARPVEPMRAEQPLWPYTWGRIFRVLSLPFDLLYPLVVTRTIVIGGEHLADLPLRVLLAGTHRSFADLPLVRQALRQTRARALAGRLVVPAAAGPFAAAGRVLAWYAAIAFGLYPLRQYSQQDASLRRLAKLAAAGSAVLIFPQGRHVTLAQEQAGDPDAAFRPGVAHLADALDAAVIPFGLAGPEHIVPPSAEDFRGIVIGPIPVTLGRGPMAIAFGPPLHIAPGETLPAFTARVQAVCYELARQAQAALDKG